LAADIMYHGNSQNALLPQVMDVVVIAQVNDSSLPRASLSFSLSSTSAPVLSTTIIPLSN
jgi:hypothetical protein